VEHLLVTSTPSESPEPESEAGLEGIANLGFTDDELRSMTQSTDSDLLALLGLC
jgi:hypothetical protein